MRFQTFGDKSFPSLMLLNEVAKRVFGLIL